MIRIALDLGRPSVSTTSPVAWPFIEITVL
jgi:hypothetical protein